MDILSSTKAISCLIVLLSFGISFAVDSPVHSLSISDGMTFVSQGGNFKLGFFSPGTSKNRFLGIWYKDIPIQTVVWVANSLTPINDSSGSLTLNSTGHLVLSQNNSVVWYTSLLKQAQNPVVQLLDSGNLVVRDENEANPEAYLWQSFDYPSDTMLPGMKFGWDLKNNINRVFTAWKSPDDPAPGDFYFTIVLNNYPDFYMMKGRDKYFRTGPWNGLSFSGSPELKPNPLFNYSFIYNQDEVYYTFSLKSNSVITRLVMDPTTYVRRRYVWTEDTKSWNIYSTVPQDYCDTYALCGAYGNCVITDSPVCECLQGFRPKLLQNWNSMDWSGGCVRNKPLGCKGQQKDGFAKMVGLKLPDTTHTWLDKTMSLEQCREKCLNNCSCMAYANSDIRGQGSGCVMWLGDLIDIRKFSAGGQDLYVRMAASELESQNGGKRRLTIIVTTAIAAISGMLLVGCYCIRKVHRNMTVIPHSLKSRSFFFILPEKSKNKEDGDSGGHEDDLDLPLFDLSTIATATNNFSIKNKIGEGGFGPVYKGRLEHGQEIAVKRLSKSSGQGMIEFKNEVRLIAKLQHRNLVKLLGCCIQEREKMLVYEYMPNSSLDTFIFDPAKSKVLYWPRRYQIICGIARGLLYLHQDSRLRIIHRDLKASNVLLDANLNPKISDFGMARIFGGDQIEGSTKKVVGTYGYMAPEYAADGLFSVKSDVFSFGILLFEIISGKRNRGFHHADHTHNLTSRAWSLWKEGRALELVDQNIEESCNLSEVLRCLHISLLCVQQHPEDRPNMSSVVLMLGSEIELPRPKQPGFFVTKGSHEVNSYSSQLEAVSTNEITITQLDAR